MTPVPYRRIVTLMGIDVGERSTWAFEWDDGRGSGSHSIPADRLARLTALLDEALPGQTAADRQHPPAERQTAMVRRCTSGSFSVLDEESTLSAELGAMLLGPPDSGLVARLLSESQQLAPHGGPAVLLRILPAASCVRIPWELLATGLPAHTGNSGQRLIELADIEMIAPLLSRDVPAFRDPKIRHRTDENSGPLHVIDPVVPHVLTAAQHERWRQRVSPREARSSDSPRPTDARLSRAWLSRRLRSWPPPSRLLYVGHVTTSEQSAGSSALDLDDTTRTYGVARANGAPHYRRPFSARDALVGTLGYSALWPSDDARRARFDTADPEVPDAARDSDGQVTEVSGSELWPMPSRVALVACESGTDLSHLEPFGLVTAFLELGAELVTATRWVMLTDTAFALTDVDDEPFWGLIVTVDELHESADDPVRGLCSWQRMRLNDWRASGSLADSPIVWAAVTTYHALDRPQVGLG